MNVLSASLLAVAAVLSAPRVVAQDQATSLFELSRNAAVIVRATVLGASDPSPAWHRLELRADEVLKGDVGGTFSLLEPSGACCGRTLFSLQAGDQVLMFLQRRSATLHPLGGGRGVMPADGPELAALRALLAATSHAAVQNVLAAQLASPTPRVAADAAHALAALPNLNLDAAQRAVVNTALQQALAQHRSAAAALCEVAARQGDAAAIDTLLPAYLGSARADQGQLLRRALLRCPPGDVAARLPQFTDATPANTVRAAELLVEMPAPDATAGLQQLMQRAPHPRVQLGLAEAFLAAGVRGQSLAEVGVPEPVRRLAERRANQAPRFRVITPSRR